MALLAVLLLSSGCSTQAAVDEVGLHFSGGPIEGRKFQRIINPGSGSTILGIADDVFWLPVGQRNYIVSKKAQDGDRPVPDFIRVPTKGGVMMDFEISVYFKLNTSTNDIKDFKGGTLRKFYEEICRKYKCDTEDGWDKMLNDNFRKIIETSMRQKVFNFGVEELYANADSGASGTGDAIQKIQEEIAQALKDNVNSSLGGNYFCGPTFEREGDECPAFQFIINSATPADENVINSFEAQRIAANEVITAENKAKSREAEARGTAAVKKAEAQGIVDAQNALRDLSPQFLKLQEIEAMKACATSGKTICIFGGSGQGINLNLPAG